MKKLVSIMLVLMLAVSVLAACGGDTGGIKNGGIKSNDLKDSSEGQQRWLRLPDGKNQTTGEIIESNLVINPDEYSGGASGNFNRLPLNIGFLDDSDKVQYKVNDIMFLVESNAANGIGGTDVFVPLYDQDAEGDDAPNVRYTVKKMTCDVEGTKVTATILDGDATASQQITMRSKIPVDLSYDYVAVINVISTSGGNVKWKIDGTTTKPTYSILAQNDSTDTGLFAFNLSEIFMPQIKETDNTADMNLSITLTLIGAKSPIVFEDYKIVSVERGFKYAAADAKTTWYPYGIVSSLTYPNGTAAEVMDYFADYNTVARKITFTQNGAFYLAGKVQGKCTYDEKKNWIIVEGDGFNYVISPKKKQNIQFYNSEADLLSRQNGTSEPTSSTQYWAVSCGRLELGDESSLYVAVSFDTKKSIDDLAEASKGATQAGNTAKRIELNVEYWDKYLAAITIPSDLILASAPAKK